MIDGQRLFAMTDWLKIAAAFCLGPALIGGIVAILAFVAGSFPAVITPAAPEWLAETGGRMVFGSLLAAVAAPVALAGFAGLMRFGLAGWAVVLVVSSLAAVGVWRAGAEIVLTLFVFWMHAFCLWTCANAIEPDALARPADAR